LFEFLEHRHERMPIIAEQFAKAKSRLVVNDHRPDFQMLCKACNSAKNNRMTLGRCRSPAKTEASREIISMVAQQRVVESPQRRGR